MENLGYYNGQIGLIEDIQIPMNDRACFFGDGVYDATYTINHNIFALDEHMDRFFNSAALLGIHIHETKDEMKTLLKDLVQKVDDDELFVYWQVTRGTAPRGHAFPPADVKPNIWVFIRPGKLQDVYTPIRLITVEDQRFEYCDIKTINLIPNVLAAQKVAEAGVNEAVFHRGNIVTECAHSNIHILKDGVFKTHPTDQFILPGIARMKLIGQCKKLNIPVDESTFTLDELFAADEIIVTSSGSLCLPVEEIDGKPVGGKAPELLKQMQDAVLKEFLDATAK